MLIIYTRTNSMIFICGIGDHIDIHHLGLPFVPYLLGIKRRSDRNPVGDVGCLPT